MESWDNNLQMCRACLEENCDFKSVFVSDESCGENIHLAEMLMECASVQVTLGDGLPELICEKCTEKTVNLFLFKRQCEINDSRLRDMLGKSPLNLSHVDEEKIDEPEAYKQVILDQDTVEIETNDSPENITVELEALILKEEHNVTENKEVETEEIEAEPDINFELDPKIDSEDTEEQKISTKNDAKNEFKCETCGKCFSRASALSRHEETHLFCRVRDFVCTICDKEFTREDLLLRHKIAHAIKMDKRIENRTKENTEVKSSEKYCNTCDIFFLTDAELEGHNLKQHKDGSKALTCQICKKSFPKPSKFKRHMKVHATAKSFKCKECGKCYNRHEQLLNHMNYHIGVKPHVCSICKKGFNQISNLKDHMRTHNGERPFLCSTCGKGFNQLGNLRQHTIRHSGVKAHLCSTCGSGFASKGELSAHVRKHTGARPFVCNLCNHGFTTSSSLTKHKRIHSGEKPYECDVCHQKFSRSGILARHKRTHTGEKPYVCNFCSKAFSQSNDLTSHQRIHTGEKPYICDVCGQAFRQTSALKTHKRTHSNEGQKDGKLGGVPQVKSIYGSLSGTLGTLLIPFN